MPIIEALMLGTPVIASDLAVFRELCGEIPEYLDPLDGPAWKGMILEYSQSSSHLRLAQQERMRDYQPPTWERHFDIVSRLMRQVINGC